MDNTLKLKIEEFERALGSLRKALDEDESELARDSAVKRFEYTFELAWKSGKTYLRDKLGVDVFSPKDNFRELKKQNILSDADTEMCMQMVDDRNAIIHTYNETFADELYQKIKKNYFKLLDKIYTQLSR